MITRVRCLVENDHRPVWVFACGSPVVVAVRPRTVVFAWSLSSMYSGCCRGSSKRASFREVRVSSMSHRLPVPLQMYFVVLCMRALFLFLFLFRANERRCAFGETTCSWGTTRRTRKPETPSIKRAGSCREISACGLLTGRSRLLVRARSWVCAMTMCVAGTWFVLFLLFLALVVQLHDVFAAIFLGRLVLID